MSISTTVVSNNNVLFEKKENGNNVGILYHDGVPVAVRVGNCQFTANTTNSIASTVFPAIDAVLPYDQFIELVAEVGEF